MSPISAKRRSETDWQSLLLAHQLPLKGMGGETEVRLLLLDSAYNPVSQETLPLYLTVVECS